MSYIQLLDTIAKQDVAVLEAKDKEYGSSWCRRGGVGAFMMAARKWDRLENQVKSHLWDVFHAIATDQRAEGILDDIRDLRRYLLLIDAYMVAQGDAGTVMATARTEEEAKMQGMGQVPTEMLPERVQSETKGLRVPMEPTEEVIIPNRMTAQHLSSVALAKQCWEEQNQLYAWALSNCPSMHAFIEDLNGLELNSLWQTYYLTSPRAFALALLDRWKKANGTFPEQKLSNGRTEQPAPFGFEPGKEKGE